LSDAPALNGFAHAVAVGVFVHGAAVDKGPNFDTYRISVAHIKFKKVSVSLSELS